MKHRHYMTKTHQMRFPQRPRPGVYQSAFNNGVSSGFLNLQFFQSLKTEDKILFGIALFVGIAALGLVIFGGGLFGIMPIALFQSQRAPKSPWMPLIVINRGLVKV